MATYTPAKKNTAFIFYCSLSSQADTRVFQTNPTLATGDVKVSTDGGTEADITTLPVVTPAGSKRVKVTLSADEMNGDNVQVTFSDAAGAEWCDLTINIATAANQIDDLAIDVYHARVNFCRDQTNAQDEYTVTWFKNGVPQTSVTLATLQLIKRADGSDLLASTSMTQIGATGRWRYTTSGSTNRLTVGEAVLARVTATIDAATRTFEEPVSRDSA